MRLRKLLLALLLISSLLITSCVEIVLIGAGVAAGGAIGYYAGKEGYKVKVEKEKEKE